MASKIIYRYTRMVKGKPYLHYRIIKVGQVYWVEVRTPRRAKELKPWYTAQVAQSLSEAKQFIKRAVK